MNFIFYFLAATLIYLSFKSYLGGIGFLNYVRSELAKPASRFTPFVSVIAPCKGNEEGLVENLSALLEQDYPAYEVLFVVDDPDDPASEIIKRLISRNARRCKLVVAPKAFESSQKAENLREAVLHVDDDSKVFVFVDSDVRAVKSWLSSLVAPLENERIGAATGYRWFISEKLSLAAELRSAWNASIASALGPNQSSNFCWGGSMAIRRSVFESLNMRDVWHGIVSDDFAATRALKDAGLGIHFVPQALTPSLGGCSFGEMLEFTNRQMKITRVYASHLWLMSYFGSFLFSLTMISAFVILVTSTSSQFTFWAAVATVALVIICSVGKSYLRWKAVKLILTGYPSQINRQLLPQSTLWLFTPVVFFYNCIAATFSRRITWRGITYEMVSPTKTRLIGKPVI